MLLPLRQIGQFCLGTQIQEEGGLVLSDAGGGIHIDGG
jgi:hypothetical protein